MAVIDGVTADDFRRMADELVAHPELTLEQARFGEPLTGARFDEVVAGVAVPGGMPPFRPPAGMRELYTTADGITVHWQRTVDPKLPGGGLVAGRIELLPLEQVFGDWVDVCYFGDEDPDEFFQPVDLFIEEGRGGLHLAQPGPEAPMYLQLAGERAQPMRMTFARYLEWLLVTRGFWYWQTAFADREYDNPYVPEPVEATNVRTVLPALFGTASP